MEIQVFKEIPAKSKLDRGQVFTDIQSAYDRLAQLHECGELNVPAKILVHDGVYRISRPLHFYGSFPVTVEAVRPGKVIVTGGCPVDNWRKIRVNGRTVFRASVSEKITELPFFYVNGKAADPARWPKKGWLRVADGSKDGLWTDESNRDNFHVSEGDFDPRWYDPQNILIRMIHLWIDENLKFGSYDAGARKITTASLISAIPKKENTEFAYTNVREALSEPNEFYFDRLKHEILYIPEKPDRPFEAEIPVIGTLVRIDSGARWVTLKGIRFRSAGNYLPVRNGKCLDLRDPGFGPLTDLSEGSDPRSADDFKPTFQSVQAAVHVPGVILFDHAADCAVEECEISGCSRYGIEVVSACRSLTFRNNHLHHLGAGGILVFGADSPLVEKDPSLQVSRIVICGNHIHDCGLFYHSATGIVIMHAWGCLLEDNHIHDLYYSGISCGWVWGYGDSVTHDIRIHHNHIHDLGKGLLSDMGGIYLLGVQPGTRVWENTVHHIRNRYYGGWGLYTDEGSSHIVFERNVVYECACEGFHQHYGRENIVRYNIFALNHQNGLAISRDRLLGYRCPGEPHGKVISFLNNVIITDGTPVFTVAEKAIFEERKFYSDGNIFFDLSGKNGLPFAKVLETNRPLSLKEWQAAGYDRHSVAADPGLVNIRKYDFRLKRNSILRDFGFTETPDAVK